MGSIVHRRSLFDNSHRSAFDYWTSFRILERDHKLVRLARLLNPWEEVVKAMAKIDSSTNQFVYGKRFFCHIVAKMADVFFSQDSYNSRRWEMRRLDERLDHAMEEVIKYKQNWRYCLRLVFNYLRCIIGVRYMYDNG